MKQLAPDKKYIPAPITKNNTCACSECPYMKLNTLEKIYNCMKNESPQISVKEDVIVKAKKAMDNMLSLG